jgi:hypothetical protein
MKKQALLLAAVLVFAVSMLAQDSRSNSGSSWQYPSGSSGQSGSMGQSGSDTQSGSSGSMGQYGSQTGSASSSSSGTDVEGCIFREASDYYIYPTKGSQMKVSGQDVSSHLGHHVKLHGSKQAGPAASASAGGVSGTVGGTDTPSASGSASAGQGSMAGSAGGHAGSASAGNEFVVERVDMVSASCPSKIRKKIESQGGNLGTGDTGTNPSSSNPPQH